MLLEVLFHPEARGTRMLRIGREQISDLDKHSANIMGVLRPLYTTISSFTSVSVATIIMSGQELHVSCFRYTFTCPGISSVLFGPAVYRANKVHCGAKEEF